MVEQEVKPSRRKMEEETGHSSVSSCPLLEVAGEILPELLQLLLSQVLRIHHTHSHHLGEQEEQVEG